jgi:hypothetical protein
MAEEPKAEKLKEERQLLAPRLTAFLIGNSVFVLGFGTMIGNALFLSQVLGFIGLALSSVSLAHFWRLPRRLDALQGKSDKGVKRFLATWVEVLRCNVKSQ